jgi:hypothetical protein
MHKQTDQELCQLAAKAADIHILDWLPDGDAPGSGPACIIEGGLAWNPLDSDGFALQLAVQLGIDLVFDYVRTETVATFGIHGRQTQIRQPWSRGNNGAGDDPMWATRRTIVCAASAIGSADT